MSLSKETAEKIADQLSFNADGLIPAIASEVDTNEILMMAWMNKEAVIETLMTDRVCYYSRSRQKLWRKGESSGQQQILKEFRTDCDQDTIVVNVEQTGVACHTGRKSCFSWGIKGDKVEPVEDVLVDPDDLYGSKS